MDNMKFEKDDTFLIEYLDSTMYGKIAHFYSMNEGNYYSRVIEKDNILLYDRLSKEEENDLNSELYRNEYQEV